MKIFYVTNARLPTEKAHGLATIKLCEAFARRGMEVVIFAPWRINPLKQDLYEYYQVKRNFKVCFLPSLDFLWLGFGQRFLFLVQLFSFSIVAAFWLLIRYGIWGQLRHTVVFSHDHIPIFFASFFSPNIFYDAHHYPEKTLLYTRVLKRAVGISVQTRWKIQKLYEDFGVSQERVVWWPNGTDIERFDVPLSKKEARQQLKLPPDKKIALYTGSLQKWKGVETLVKAAEFLPSGCVVYIVGGDKGDIEKYEIPACADLPAGEAGASAGRSNPTRLPDGQESEIRFVGQRPWSQIPIWLKAADVLVLPNTARMKVSQYYTSPMKLFEYMASGVPIVASDIPSVREIVDETMVFFARPDDPASFALTIQEALNSFARANLLLRRGQREVQKYTWNERAQRIIGLINSVKYYSRSGLSLTPDSERRTGNG